MRDFLDLLLVATRCGHLKRRKHQLDVRRHEGALRSKTLIQGFCFRYKRRRCLDRWRLLTEKAAQANRYFETVASEIGASTYVGGGC